MVLDECRKYINRKVVYTPSKSCGSSELEYGVITGVNTKFAFVRYGSDINSKATRAEDLTLDL